MSVFLTFLSTFLIGLGAVFSALGALGALFAGEDEETPTRKARRPSDMVESPSKALSDFEQFLERAREQ